MVSEIEGIKGMSCSFEQELNIEIIDKKSKKFLMKSSKVSIFEVNPSKEAHIIEVFL